MADNFTVKVQVQSDEPDADSLKQAILDGRFSIDGAIQGSPDGAQLMLFVGQQQPGKTGLE